MLVLIVGFLTSMYSSGISMDAGQYNSILTRIGRNTDIDYSQVRDNRRSASTLYNSRAPIVNGLTEEEIDYINDLREECKSIKKTRRMSQNDYIVLKKQCLFDADPNLTLQQLNFALQDQANNFNRNRKFNNLYDQYHEEQYTDEIETAKINNKNRRKSLNAMWQQQLKADQEAFKWTDFYYKSEAIENYYDNY